MEQYSLSAHICGSNTSSLHTRPSMDTTGKEEISDTDSGIILTSGPDSPASPVKDLATHTRAVQLKQRALHEHLDECVLELRKLCLREAELTGHLSPDFPLQAGETPPRVHRRVGATYTLQHRSNSGQEGEERSVLSLENTLALQTQILQATRHLSLEERLSGSVRRKRLQQCRVEERKLKHLQSNLELGARRSTPHADLLTHDVQLCEHCPIQNSPWRESCLDQPSRSTSSSPSRPMKSMLGETSLPLMGNSATYPPELQLHRPQADSLRLPKPDTGEMCDGSLPRRLLEDCPLTPHKQSSSPPRPHPPPYGYHHSNYAAKPRPQPRAPPTYEQSFGDGYMSTQSRESQSLEKDVGETQNTTTGCVQATNLNTSRRLILQRAPDGTPTRWFEEENSEIVSQV